MRYPLIALAVAVFSACSTVQFHYPAPQAGPDTGVAVAIAGVKNELGFQEPNRLRFNVTMDRPVADAVREALASELTAAGYRVGDSAVRLTAAIQCSGIGNARDDLDKRTQMSFVVQRGSDPARLYRGNCESTLPVGSIWDSEGIIAQLKDCITKFITDPNTEAAFTGRRPPAPEPSAATTQPAPAPSAPTQPASDVDEPAFAAREQEEADFAVVVGVESYQRPLPKAVFAERDAKTMAKYLRGMGVPPRQMKVLVGSDATSSKLRAYLHEWLPRNVKPGSRVFFYFSGHGAPDAESGSAYLVPWDGDPEFLKDTAVSLDDVYGSLNKLGAKSVLVALDACFSGAGGRSVLKPGARPLVTQVSAGPLPTGLTVLTAGGDGQVTGTLDGQGHGIFTYYLLKGLNAGLDDSAKLCAFLKPKVADEAALANGEQMPVCRGPAFDFGR